VVADKCWVDALLFQKVPYQLSVPTVINKSVYINVTRDEVTIFENKYQRQNFLLTNQTPFMNKCKTETKLNHDIYRFDISCSLYCIDIVVVAFEYKEKYHKPSYFV